MKAKIWTIPLALLLGGCDDLLTESPDAFLAPDNFYRTAGDAEAALVSVYAPLVENSGFRESLWHILQIPDDLTSVNRVAGAALQRLNRLAFTPDLGNFNGAWTSFYTTINRANLVIERVPRIQMNEARRASIVGEAKFLRALANFYLLRAYGDVPLVTTEEEATTRTTRTPAEQVYQQIIQDARDAAEALPRIWPSGTGAGRPAQGAALVLLADVHLTRQEWQQAAGYAKQIIDSGVYRLYPDYLHAFLPAYENGPEHLFSLQATGGSGPTSKFVQELYPRELGVNLGGGFASILPASRHHRSYASGDYRHDVSFFTQGCNIQGQCRTFAPHIHKFRPTNTVPVGAGDVNWTIYRYAEVLLIYAEARNELGGSAEAVQYLNQVRQRARNADGSARSQPADYAGPLTRDAVREAILRERTWELAYEGKRWFDLTRRGADYFMSQLARDPEVTDLQPTDMLWPIPLAEIDVNSDLEQNPGY